MRAVLVSLSLSALICCTLNTLFFHRIKSCPWVMSPTRVWWQIKDKFLFLRCFPICLHKQSEGVLQDAEPWLLVADPCGGGRHSLDGLWQQVNWGPIGKHKLVKINLMPSFYWTFTLLIRLFDVNCSSILFQAWFKSITWLRLVFTLHNVVGQKPLNLNVLPRCLCQASPCDANIRGV